MILEHFLVEPGGIEANMYLLGCTKTHEAMLIDCGAWDQRIEAALAKHNLKLTTIFITHGHYDHVNGLAQAIKATGARAYSAAGEVNGIKTLEIGPGEKLWVGEIEGRVVATPGHTPDGLSLIFPGLAFTGDALFSGSVGGTATPALAAEQLDRIRQYLLTLPDHYEVHPGHGACTTIAVERQFNPFLI